MARRMMHPTKPMIGIREAQRVECAEMIMGAGVNPPVVDWLEDWILHLHATFAVSEPVENPWKIKPV